MRKLTLPAISVTIGLCCSSVWSSPAGYEVSGLLRYRAYDFNTNPFCEKALAYKVVVGASSWQITTTPLVTNEDEALLYSSVGTDGTNIYSLKYLNTNYRLPTTIGGLPIARLWTNAAGTASSLKPRNKVVADVYSGPVPRGDGSFAAPLWLAFASQQHLNSSTNGKVRTAWVDGSMYNTNPIRAAVTRCPHPPQLPTRIVYINEGFRFREESGGALTKLMLPPPYDKDFVDSLFEVLELTNTASLTVPRRFKFVKYTPVSDARSSAELRELGVIEGTTLSLSQGSVEADLRPSVPAVTAVFDARPAIRGGDARGLSYLVASNWPDEATVRALWTEERSRRARRESSSHAKRLAIYTLLAGCAISAAILLKSAKGR